MVVVVAVAVGCGVKAEAEATASAKSVPAKAEAPAKAREAAPAPSVAPPTVHPKTPATLAEAITLAHEIHAGHRMSFYCGCSYTDDLRVLPRSCGYKTRADENRSRAVQWTHVVPPRAFGAGRACWTTEACTREDGSKYGGIECCRAQDPAFAAIENDVNNLVPAIGEVAEDRSDYPFGEVAGEPRLYGACDLEVDAAANVVEPPDRMRGDIARVHLYMHAAWGDAVPLTPAQVEQFQAWHADDPPDAWELERAAKIQAAQGFAHPWLPADASAATVADAPAPTEDSPAGARLRAKAESKPRATAKPGKAAGEGVVTDDDPKAPDEAKAPAEPPDATAAG